MPALTGIRAIAAYMVYFHHFNPFTSYRESRGAEQIIYSIVNELHIGVSIFFVLSGFLICYRYYNQITTINKQWFGRYLMNRAARIYPMFFILTILTFVVIRVYPEEFNYLPSGIKSEQSIGQYFWLFALNISLFKSIFDDYKYTGISQAWSLTVEECFYLLAPSFMLFVRYDRRALIILPIVVLSLMAGLTLTIGRLDFHGLFHGFKFMLNYTFFGRCIEFFAGMALAVFILKKRQTSTSTHSCILFTLSGTISIAGCLVLLAFIGGKESSRDSIAGILLANSVLPLAVVSLFYGLITEKSWLRYLLSNKLFDILGKSSYIFYLIHVGVISVILKHLLFNNVVLRTISLIVISILMYFFIEAPMHKWLKPKSSVN